MSQTPNPKPNTPTTSNQIPRDEVDRDDGKLVLIEELAKALKKGDQLQSEIVLRIAKQQIDQNEIERLIKGLSENVEREEAMKKRIEDELFEAFLRMEIEVKQRVLEKTKRELEILRGDLRDVRRRRGGGGDGSGREIEANGKGAEEESIGGEVGCHGHHGHDDEKSDVISAVTASSGENHVDKRRRKLNGSSRGDGSGISKEERNARCARLCAAEALHGFQEAYFGAPEQIGGQRTRTSIGRELAEGMRIFTEYSSLAQIGDIKWAPDQTLLEQAGAFSRLPIITWMDFDRSSERIALSSLAKQIKIYDFSQVSEMRRNSDEDADAGAARQISIYCPLQAMRSTGKLNCLKWNPAARQLLLTSDRDGVVGLWNVDRGTVVSEFDEHDGSVWCVDFHEQQPSLFASVGNDSKVKIWDVNSLQSTITIPGTAPVCSVKFHPDKINIAFGGVDQHVYYYDLRNPAQPLRVMKCGSRVSYVNFLTSNELAAGVLNSTVCVWNLEQTRMKQELRGHKNTQFFVGRAVTSDYIATGSEDNTLFVHYKGVACPVAKYTFPASDLLTGQDNEERVDSGYVPAVAWSKKLPTTLVASDTGNPTRIHILQLRK